jgi:hypothetical protein
MLLGDAQRLNIIGILVAILSKIKVLMNMARILARRGSSSAYIHEMVVDIDSRGHQLHVSMKCGAE